MIRALIVLLALTLVALCTGATTITPLQVWHLLLAHNPQDFVVWSHRFPRSLTGILIGAALGVAGALVQGVIRNPLASPDILGVTQGAGLAVAFVLLVFPGVGYLPFFSLLGGAAGAALLMAYNAGIFSPVRFALSGVAVSATFAGVTQFLLLTHPVEVNTALLSLTGSLWARGWPHLGLLLPLIPLMMVAMTLAKPLDVIALGEDTAHALGTRLRLVRWAAITMAVMLTAISVSVAGPVGFVGLVAPHLARRLVGGGHLRLLPTAGLLGAAILLAADTLGRGIAPPAEIPAGVLTAVIGAPYFLWLLFRTR
jgi:iron complex transport system permease protein